MESVKVSITLCLSEISETESQNFYINVCFWIFYNTFWSKTVRETKVEIKDHVRRIHETNHVLTLFFIHCENTVISPNFRVWKFCEKAQFLHSFRPILVLILTALILSQSILFLSGTSKLLTLKQILLFCDQPIKSSNMAIFNVQLVTINVPYFY